MRSITSNGTTNIWWRCDNCQANVLGAGYWTPHEYLLEHSVDIETLEILSDQRVKTPPCAVCGTRGSETHHWAPRHLFGAEADLWPTVRLCRRCHQRWYRVVEHQGSQSVVPLPIDTAGGDTNEPSPLRSA